MGEFLTACEESKRSMRESQRSEAFSVLESNLEVLGHIDSGVPVQGTETKGWELRRVHTYDVDHYGEKPPGISTLRPFYKDYRHYKHYGFAGKGAKTSWGYNPKHTHMIDTSPDPKELYTYVKGSSHDSWKSTGVRSVIRKSTSSTPMKSAVNKSRHSTAAKPSPWGTASDDRGPSNHTIKHSIQESQILTVDLARMSLLDCRRDVASGPQACVLTYPTMATDSWGGNLVRPQAPHHNRPQFDKAQAPFHQRYSHYKYYGFAGHGAKTSWATGSFLGP